jgi:hypothetical protein
VSTIRDTSSLIRPNSKATFGSTTRDMLQATRARMGITVEPQETRDLMSVVYVSLPTGATTACVSISVPRVNTIEASLVSVCSRCG